MEDPKVFNLALEKAMVPLEIPNQFVSIIVLSVFIMKNSHGIFAFGKIGNLEMGSSTSVVGMRLPYILLQILETLGLYCNGNLDIAMDAFLRHALLRTVYFGTCR